MARFLNGSSAALASGGPGDDFMMTEDFTKLPVGAVVSGSRPIVRCSICDRNGALELQLRRCVHREGSTINVEGLVTEPIDSCAPVVFGLARQT